MKKKNNGSVPSHDFISHRKFEVERNVDQMCVNNLYDVCALIKYHRYWNKNLNKFCACVPFYVIGITIKNINTPTFFLKKKLNKYFPSNIYFKFLPH